MKTLFKAVATVTIFSIITRLLGFLFRIFLSRKLGAEGLGLYQMATSVLGIFMTLIASGIPISTAKLVSKYETSTDIKKRNKVVASSLIIAILLSVLSCVLIYLLKSAWGIMLKDNRVVEIIIILIPSIIFSAIYAIFRGALWGQSDYFNVGLTELIEQIIRFALTFIILFRITDYFIAAKYTAITFNIACLLSAIITIFIYFKFKHGRLSLKKGEFKNIIKSAAPITGVRLANSLIQPLTTLIIPTLLIATGYSNSEAVSSLGVIMGMTLPMLFVPMAIIGSISMVLIPSITSLMNKKEYSTIEQNISKSIEISVFVCMLFIPLYLSVGDLIGLVLYKNAMSGVMLQLSAVCVLPIVLCNLSGSILNALNLETKSFVNYIIGSVILFGTLVIFTPIIGINSIMLAFFLSMLTVSILNLRKIKKAVPSLELNLPNLVLRYALIILPCSLIGHFISNISLYIMNNFFAALIGGCTSIALTIFLSFVFNIYNVKELFTMIKRKKSKQKEAMIKKAS